MKRILALSALFLLVTAGFAQKYKTTTGSISFFSKAPLENIEAKSNQATAILDASNGAMAFLVLIKSFEFDKSLMQDHFNDNYMESDTYPKATFEGKLTNYANITFGKDGTYNAGVSGKLTIHGVTKDINESGSLIISGGNITLKSTFIVKLVDYNIKNDKVQNISDAITVTVNCTLVKQ